ncbi:MAG: DUF2723 domain-containing protein [Candidatus Neomarinimicrobiota bacterium]
MPVKRQNRVLAGAAFFISFIIYMDTLAPTVSFWDCGEFIATSYTLGVPHPPGSPLYLILGRIFSMIPFGEDIGFRVNLISPLVSALAVMFLYLIIVQFVSHWRGPVKSREDRVVAFGSGLVGSLAFAFTDSHWFNAVEAEVYAVSTLFTAMVVWLILHWAERSDKPGNERYILIISYLLGLATGVHLLNLLALPFMGMIIYFKKRKFTWKSFLTMAAIVAATFLVIYLGIIKGFPKLATVVGVGGVGFLFIVFLGATGYVILRHYRLWSVVLSSLLLVTIGYSTYSILFIRSNQDPSIDENDPETVERAVKYLEREQYGAVTFLPRRYIKSRVGNPNHKMEVVGRPRSGREFSSSQDLQYMFHDFGRQIEFLWNYQIVRMYLRYFLWQFAGRGPAGERWVSSYGALANRNEDGVDWIQFGLPLSFLLGILGLVYHFRKDRTQALSVIILFFLTGLAVILYLNQDKFQPRERDYSYVGSFLAFSIWIGIGASAILEKVLHYFRQKPFRLHATYGTALLLLLAVPSVMAVKNYRSHNRSGNFVAWDYSYNILQTCEPNAIIFTNGDNDTFPLWYLQEVEGIRKDVTVANLSLLNTEWYIRQLKESRPPGERLVNFTDAQILGEKSIGRNPATGDPLFLDVSLWKKTSVSIPAPDDTLNGKGEIRWEVKPTMGQGIRVQDLMIIHIVKESQWKYPVYFAVTVSPKNRIGLEKYLQMEGLAFRLKSHAVPLVNFERLRTNLTTVITDTTWTRDYQPGYRYRNLNNPHVYFNPNVVKLLQNYRSAFMELGFNEARNYRRVQKNPMATDDELERARHSARQTLQLMGTVLPETVIPVSNEDMQFRLGYLYHEIGETEKAVDIYRNLHGSARPEIIASILRAYDDMGLVEDAIGLLEMWLVKNPGDTGVKKLLEEYKGKTSQPPDS